MSARTAKYVEAMIREGDYFDYGEWLVRVREEEAEAQQAEATGTSGELAAAEIDKPITTPHDQHPPPHPILRLTTKSTRASRALRRPLREATSRTPKARLRRWLQEVRGAWDDFQASRARDAVYGYLEAVFAIVPHYRVRRRTQRLLRHAFKFADRPFDKNAEPFRAVIRCTCGDVADAKMISKWSRALRFAASAKRSRTSLKGFMKKMGGVNACATLYAKHFGRSNRGCDLRRTC